MPGILISALAIIAASLLTGRALFLALGHPDRSWIEPALGLATLIVFCHIAIALPGPSLIAVLLLVLLLAGAALLVLRARSRASSADVWKGTDAGVGPPRFAAARSADERGVDAGGRPQEDGPARRPVLVGVVVTVLVLALSSAPFALNARTGVLGEGIYSNDHAVHLYWADWLQNEVGEKPKGIGWGYPVGPHSLVATTAEATGISVEETFNGLLLAIPALTALTALAMLGRLPPVRRTVAAVLVGMPFLVVSFFAQSSFKETALALFVLAFALSLAALSREGPAAPARPSAKADRALLVGVGLFAVAAVLTFSLPGLAWFGLGVIVWFAVESIAGRPPFSLASLGAGLRRAWPLLAIAALVVAVLAIVEAGTLSRFAERIREVQESQGRLSARLPPWEVLGIWPRGDFRVGAGAIGGAEIAIAFSLIAAAVSSIWWLRKREYAIPAIVATALAVFIAARISSGIHVEAKALIVASPLVMLFIVRGLLEGVARGPSAWRIALGSLFAATAMLSTHLALRTTPVGTPAHADELAQLQREVRGKDVVFLGLDRFVPYRLRGAERVQSPGGYVPNALRNREAKVWGQSEAVDFDSLDSRVLDRFKYAVTTGAAYGSSAPPNWSRVASTENFVLFKRDGKAPEREVLGEDPAPGAILSCADGLATATGTAGVWTSAPVLADKDPWRPDGEILAGGTARLELLLAAGTWQLSLQYNSEVPLTLRSEGLERDLPAALDGFYSNSPGKGPFWPAGEVKTDGGTVEIEVTADEAPALSRLVGAERRAWLGDLAAVRLAGKAADPPGPRSAERARLSEACGGYVDWYVRG